MVSASSSAAKLIVVGGERDGSTFEITRSLAIGSHRHSDLHLRDPAVSWRHARIWPEGGSIYVEDLGSASGTILNGQPVRRSELQAGDTVDVGSCRMVVSIVRVPMIGCAWPFAPSTLPERLEISTLTCKLIS